MSFLGFNNKWHYGVNGLSPSLLTTVAFKQQQRAKCGRLPTEVDNLAALQASFDLALCFNYPFKLRVKVGTDYFFYLWRMEVALFKLPQDVCEFASVTEGLLIIYVLATSPLHIVQYFSLK